MVVGFFLGLVGDVFRVFCPVYPLRSVSGLVWVIGLLICGTGHVSRVVGWVFCVVLDFFRVTFFSRFFIFTFHFPCIFLAPPPVAGDMAMIFR